MTSRFRIAHATSPQWETALRECLRQLGELGQEFNLGFVYATDAYGEHAPALLAALQEACTQINWVGALSMGVMAQTQEYYDVPALALMVGALPPDAFRVLATVIHAGDGVAGARHVGTLGMHPNMALVHGDPKNLDIADLVDAVAGEMESGFLVGGLTGARGATHAQIAGQMQRGGLSGVAFSRDVAITTGLTQGCVPIGMRHRVTQCHRNLLIGLDGESALEVFKRDIGELLARDLNRVAGYIYAALPVTGRDRGDYLVRALLGIDPEQQVIAIGELIEPGDTVLFCRRDAGAARSDLKRMLNDLRRRLAGPPTGGIYFSCLGRGHSLFGEDAAELKLIREMLGDFPLIGCYCNGEIYHDRLYGYTGVLTLFCDDTRLSARGHDVKKAV